MLLDPKDPFESLFQRITYLVGSLTVALLASTTVDVLTRFIAAKMVN